MLGIEPLDVLPRFEGTNDSGTSVRRGAFGDQVTNAGDFKDAKRVIVHRVWRLALGAWRRVPMLTQVAN
jgi:hypothetical protein